MNKDKNIGGTMSKSIVALDLFAGCGGLSLGLKQAGINVAWANDFDKDAVETYRKSHPETRVFTEPAEKLFHRISRGGSNLPLRGEVDLIAGGPPCQGFSGYNRHRHSDDPRNSLVETFLDFVSYLQPRWVLMENVPGLLSLDNGSVAKLLLKILKEIGYTSKLGVLQAGYYGVPQNRWRVFILATMHRKSELCFPIPTHLFPRKTVFGAKNFNECIVKPPAKEPDLFWNPQTKVSVFDAIGDLPPIENGGGKEVTSYCTIPKSNYQELLRNGSNLLYNHQTVKLGDLMMKRCKAVPKRAGAGWLDLPESLKPKNLLRHGDNRYPNRFGRLHWDGEFNTIVHKPEPYWGAVIHPEQDRVISVRECARAQGFPDMIRFYGTVRSSYKQIGNAVPPPMARTIGLSIVGYEQKLQSKFKD